MCGGPLGAGAFGIQARRDASGGFRTKCIKKKVEEKLQEVSTYSSTGTVNTPPS